MVLSRFRQAKTAEEVNMVQNAVLKSTQYKNKWAYGLFEEWQRQHMCKTSAHVQGLYFQIGGCECELHNKNAFFELKSNFISIQNFKAGNVKPPGMHWSKDF